MIFFARWIVVLLSILGCIGCGSDEEKKNELKERCVTWCDTFKRCVPDKPDQYDKCISSCDAFDDPDSAAEYEAMFLCKETCVENATATTECTCLLSHADGGPDC